jgi:hypothetical protein
MGGDRRSTPTCQTGSSRSCASTCVYWPSAPDRLDTRTPAAMVTHAEAIASSVVDARTDAIISICVGLLFVWTIAPANTNFKLFSRQNYENK